MEYITIQGGVKLKGEVIVSGSKNSALPILASSLLTDKKLSLTKVPSSKMHEDGSTRKNHQKKPS